jgi:hypothetical protein
MYARLVRFTLAREKRTDAQGIADEIAPQIRVQPCCTSATVFGDDSDGQYGLFVLWDSPANAKAAAQVIGPKLEARLAGNLHGDLDVRLCEVLSR